MKKIKFWLDYITYTGLYAFAGIMIWTFYTAYFNPSKTVIVGINWYGEANIEIVLVTFFALIIVINTIIKWIEQIKVMR